MASTTPEFLAKGKLTMPLLWRSTPRSPVEEQPGATIAAIRPFLERH
jgi:hypothetical protein